MRVLVERFAFGGTGYGGTISTGETDYKVVLARSTALIDFEKLLAQGNLQAKCYALVATQKLNPTRFKQLTEPLAESRGTVTIVEGCIVSNVPFSQILKRIAAGEYRPLNSKSRFAGANGKLDPVPRYSGTIGVARNLVLAPIKVRTRRF